MINKNVVTDNPARLIYRGNRRWTRFPNSDAEFLSDKHALVYEHKRLFRVMSAQKVVDFKASLRGSYFDVFQDLHKFLRSLKIKEVQLFSKDKSLVGVFNGRSKTLTEEQKQIIEDMTRPYIASFSNVSVGGQRQIETLASLKEGKSFFIEKNIYGIDWSIYSNSL